MKETIQKERIKGVLIGCACGDAMGMPTEMMSREKIKEIFPEGIHDFYPSTGFDFMERKMQAGEITDDTIHTILICHMLRDHKQQIKAEDYLSYLQNWIKENPEKSEYVTGPSTRRALQAIENGTPIEKAGIFGTTNGASMKISPIGIISDYRDMESLADYVEQICLPTHFNQCAISGACAIAACVSYGVRGGNCLDDLWDIAIQAVRVGKKRGYQSPSVSLERRIKAIRELVEQNTKQQVMDELVEFYGTGGETVETIPAVLAIVHLAKGNPMIAARISAEIGGDTDTIGAISTAICGGMYPEFSDEIIEKLETVNQIQFDELVEGLLSFMRNE